MSYSIDVNGNDNQPEWGYCAAPGCPEPAYPIWYSGGFPDDPDLLLCEAHIGVRIAELELALDQAKAREAGLKLAADQYSESRDQWMLKAKAAIERGAADHAVAAAARALAAGPDSTGWERLYAALAVADKGGSE